MKCSKCGKEIKDGSDFCRYCGEKNVESASSKIPLYNTVPIWKIIVLYTLSLGAYTLVWVFNLWKQARKKYNKKIDPLMRSLFCVFTNFKLFPLLNEYITNVPNDNNETGNIDKSVDNVRIKPFPAMLFATIYMIFIFIDCVLSRTDSNSLILLTSLIDIISFAVVISMIVIIQLKINKFNSLYNIPAKNDKWTWKTTVFVVAWLFIICLLMFSL